jgi:16S rRNA (cytosine967-C5)-methyltransferase
LSQQEGFYLEEVSSSLPAGCEGLADATGYFRTFPHRHEMDGFFAARIRRG